MLKTAIFDMDGLLVDSEPLWREAEKAAFLKVDMELTDADCKLTMGNRTSEVVDYWWHRSPWQRLSPKEVEDDITENVRQLIIEKAEPLPGVDYIINFFKEMDFKIALASSSCMVLIDTVVDKLNLRKKLDIICSAENEEYGKPHPAVFLNTAKKLNVLPVECLVFEDSVLGLIAAKAAQMKCVVVPAIEDQSDQRFVLADFMLDSLEQFEEEELQNLN
ncbi:MAG: 2-deoxyglucose-6-phosphatase [Flavobacteriales bacterium]|nr:hexitol phosphatase HxpB [Bacteroidales bacterium AH-315-I05]PCJ85178.1 MAG: 2-deoxyglucose-6-phosphatase [Flavobacteriales bacterium]